MHRLDSLLELLGPQWIEALGSDMTPTVFRFLTRWANPYHVKRMGKARLGRWFQRQTRKAWGDQRAAEVVAAAETTLALWGQDGLDFEALAADIAVEASLALELTSQIKQLDDRIADLYAEADPKGILLSVPGVGDILAAQICGRLGDVSRFTSLAAARSFSGLVPRERSSGMSEKVGGPTKRGDACLREALFLAADQARRVDPTLGARYHRLICNSGRHHKAAVCSVAAVLLTRIVSCLQEGVAYEIRDLDGRTVTKEEGKAIVAAQLQIPPEIRAARRSINQKRSVPRRRDERTKRGVAKRSKVSPVPGA
jgi:hypothetical protein